MDEYKNETTNSDLALPSPNKDEISLTQDKNDQEVVHQEEVDKDQVTNPEVVDRKSWTCGTRTLINYNNNHLACSACGIERQTVVFNQAIINVDQETGPELEKVEEDVHQETAQEVENQVCIICHGTQYGSFGPAEGMPCRHDSYFHWRCRMIDFQSC